MAAPPTRLIDLRDVSRAYGPTLAVDRLTLTVGAGEVHAVLGRNGAGKTTVLRILAGLVQPAAGSASVVGVDVTRNVRAVSALVGLVPSGDRSFYLRLSAPSAALKEAGRIAALEGDDGAHLLVLGVRGTLGIY